eukprot:GDKI01011491.1.p4 GENE.GDKI01011491.1~~GDKI01011491.1.p4  ORF type:complete len:102 (-),score=55.89 GDKI01011491.1:36-341(-)
MGVCVSVCMFLFGCFFFCLRVTRAGVCVFDMFDCACLRTKHMHVDMHTHVLTFNMRTHTHTPSTYHATHTQTRKMTHTRTQTHACTHTPSRGMQDNKCQHK